MAKIIRFSSGKQTVTASIALTFISDFPTCVPWKNKACEMLKGRSGKGDSRVLGSNTVLAGVQNSPVI